MAFYYDSSLVLSVLLEQQRVLDLAAAWDEVSIRLSSNLLVIECIIGIRRSGIIQKLNPDDEWVRYRIDLLDRYFDCMHLKMMDDSIEKLIRDEPRIARCRTLDAIHLATALYFRPHLDEPLRFACLDKRLRQAADELGFGLFPEDM
jgi:hypothetical protein